MDPTDAGRRRAWEAGLVLVLILGVYYGALQNGQWGPVSDADLYVPIARSLALGHGFTFNSSAVQAIPPGWPLLLAGAMRLSTSFWLLNIFQMCLMLAALLLSYRILLRLTTVPRAFVVCLTAGILSPVYHGTFLLCSESLFCLTGAAAVLVALQVSEGRDARWRMPLVLVLTAATIMVRWAGILFCPVIIGALMCGRLKPAWNKFWLSAVLTGLVALGTFYGARYELDHMSLSGPGNPDAATYAANEHPIVRDLRGFVRRLPKSGVWFCNLLAEEGAVGASLKQVRTAAFVIGWGLLALFLAGMVPFVRKFNWVMPGAFAYSVGFFGIWDNPLPRYLVPVAPFLILGILNGIDLLGRVGRAPAWRRLSLVAMVGLFVGIAVCNLSLYAVDVWILHSDDVYGTYLAGQAKPLIAIAEYMKKNDVKDGEVVRAFVTRDKQGVSPTMGRLLDIRGLFLLINRTILTLPRDMVDGPPNAEVTKWAVDRGARFYIENPPINPWRVWHFRVPWLQKLVTGRPVGETNPYYILYELRGGQFRQVRVPDWNGRIDRIPCM